MAQRNEQISGVTFQGRTLDLWTTNSGYRWFEDAVPVSMTFLWQDPVGVPFEYPDLGAAFDWLTTL